ncbi:MAG: short-chain dehydrogenase/reductase SDR [Chloroflexi bacterium]|nr:MAG: short-chain dehydrogenase/reductase SDR [Chloroflexota bacterium]MBA4376690.1 hypothetical protein [Anaerolinea sp.]
MKPNPKTMDDKKLPLALVTGAAKRVGREIALHLARRGYAIGLHFFKSSQEAEATADEITALGATVMLLPADLRAAAQVNSMYEKIDESGFHLKILVNSASIMPRSDLMMISAIEWDDVLNTNLKSVWYCCQMAAKRMERGSVIINLSDAGSSRNWTGYGAYVVSKAGVDVLTRILAGQLAPNIRVCGIAPGLLLRSEGMTYSEWDRLVQKTPLKREGDFQSLTTTIDLLLSNEYITGDIISLDGGSHLG